MSLVQSPCCGVGDVSCVLPNPLLSLALQKKVLQCSLKERGIKVAQLSFVLYTCAQIQLGYTLTQCHGSVKFIYIFQYDTTLYRKHCMHIAGSIMRHTKQDYIKGSIITTETAITNSMCVYTWQVTMITKKTQTSQRFE